MSQRQMRCLRERLTARFMGMCRGRVYKSGVQWAHALYILISALLCVSSLSPLLSSTSPDIQITFISSAYAQSRASKDKAIQLVTEGQRLLRASNFEGAIKVWRRAYSLYPEPKLLYYIAVTYGKVNGACTQEEQAWRAYESACKDELCRAKLKQSRHAQFKERCYVQVNITSPIAGAVIDWLGTSRPLPLEVKVIRQRYDDVKVSAPGHLSRWIKLDIEQVTLNASTGEPERQVTINVPLVLIPRESTLSRHQTKILIGSAIAGVLLSSFGGLQLNSARELRDSMQSELSGFTAVKSLEDQKALSKRVNYSASLEEFERKQAWGIALVTLGVASLGVSVWSLFIKDPNRGILDTARRQGDLAQRLEQSGAQSRAQPADDESASFKAELIPRVLPTRNGAVLGWGFSF